MRGVFLKRTADFKVLYRFERSVRQVDFFNYFFYTLSFGVRNDFGTYGSVVPYISALINKSLVDFAVRCQLKLQFFGKDVFSVCGYYYVLQSAGYIIVAVFVGFAKVARVKPAVAVGALYNTFFFFVLSEHQHFAFDANFADTVFVFVYDFCQSSRQRLSDR